jgi:hypothetical protein
MMRMVYVLAMVCLAMPVTADAYLEEQRFFDTVYKRFQEKCAFDNFRKNGYSRIQECRAAYSPKKCASLVYIEDWGPWRQCVRSCAHAGTWSRNFGECS